MQLPNVILVWRLSAIREVILSGFQLELFSPEERPVAYWCSTQVLDAHLSCLDNLLHVAPRGRYRQIVFIFLVHTSTDSMAYREMVFQFQLLTALQAITTAVFVVGLLLSR
jgi:N-alpha-acetyltransferase 35, NatC auxiliary subunit